MNQEMQLPTIGLICPFWLPMWGGAEQYHFRLAGELKRRGFIVKVFCGISEASDRDNGTIEVERYVSSHDLTYATWAQVLRKRTDSDYQRLADHYDFINKAIKWAKHNEIDIALIGNPFNDPNYFHARELYASLKNLDVSVGLVHHDLSRIVCANLKNIYLKESGGWENATKKVVAGITRIAQQQSRMKWTAVLGSPLFFEPDFIITNSEWSKRFIDPLDECQKIVLHPLMDAKFWGTAPNDPSSFSMVDVLMVNPQSRKNPQLMKNIIEVGPISMKFRILKGGWGNSFLAFSKLLETIPESKSKHVELVEYVDDMRKAYRSSRLLVFPSLEEGYGMTPVEAMYSGLPVLSSSYPAIREAVGTAAKLLCPYKNSTDDWVAAVTDILENSEIWKQRSLERAGYLAARQEQELDKLAGFLGNIR